MRTNILLLFFAFVWNMQGQETLDLIDFDTKIHTRDSKYIEVNLFLAIPKNYTFDAASINKVNANIFVGNTTTKMSAPSLSNIGLKFKLNIEANDEDILQRLENLALEHHISIEKNIVFKIKKETDEKLITITDEQIKKWTKNAFFKLSKSQKEALIKEKGGEVIISENSIDLGHVSASESETGNAEYTVAFKYRNHWKNSTIGYSFEGLLGTNAKDSLNYFSAYPIIANFTELGEKFNLIGKAGIEGNQTFSSYRITADLAIQGIIPNLIDLTAGENRLRLKPVVSLGVKFYNEVKNNRVVTSSNEISNQIYSAFYYYIPIHKTFSLTLNGTGFYDLNKRVNPSKRINYNFNAVLGASVSKGFKTVFKYTKGNNFVTLEKGDFFSIGILSDLLSKIN